MLTVPHRRRSRSVASAQSPSCPSLPGQSRVALAGLGYWGSKLLRNLCGLVGPHRMVVVDPDPRRLTAACQGHPGVTPSADLAKALRDDRIIAVVVATPVTTHATLTRQALDAGCHVLVEKPFTDSAEAAVALSELAQARQRVLMVGHTFLFSPPVERMAEHVHTGGIGRVHFVTSSRFNLLRGDVNVIWDLAPHDVSIIMHLLGEAPCRVQAQANSALTAGVPDVALLNLAFPSGAIASVNVSWLVPRKVRETVLVGDRGMVVFDDTSVEAPVKLYQHGPEVPESDSFGEHQLTYRFGDIVAPWVQPSEPLRCELQHFLDCVATGSAPRSDAFFATEVVRVLEAADLSWRHGGMPVDASGCLTLAGRVAPWDPRPAPVRPDLEFGDEALNA